MQAVHKDLSAFESYFSRKAIPFRFDEQRILSDIPIGKDNGLCTVSISRGSRQTRIIGHISAFRDETFDSVLEITRILRPFSSPSILAFRMEGEEGMRAHIAWVGYLSGNGGIASYERAERVYARAVREMQQFNGLFEWATGGDPAGLRLREMDSSYHWSRA